MAIKNKDVDDGGFTWFLCDNNVFVFVSAIGEVVVAFWYKKSVTVDRTSSWPGTYCVYQCSAIVYC